MNRKKTNYIIAILNILYLILLIILQFTLKEISNYIMWGGNSVKSIFNISIIDFIFNYSKILIIILYSALGILNIIAGIQNKGNRKLCFWQISFGISQIWTIIVNLIIKDTDFLIISSCYIPALFAIINLILIKRNKPNVIRIISYIVIIVLSVLYMFEIIEIYWMPIMVIMQLIYIHYQDNNIVESKKRKILNICLYYVIQAALVLGLLILIIFALILNKINQNKYEQQLLDLSKSICSLQHNMNSNKFIPVEKNNKYGYINETGQEIIPCEYDLVSNFICGKINGKECSIAIAKKYDSYYIISKSNQQIDITNNIYLKNMFEYFYECTNSNIYYMTSITTVILPSLFDDTMNLTMDTYNFMLSKSIDLKEKNSQLYYDFPNYTITFKELDNNDKYYVTIKKKNSEENKYTLYIDINTFSNTLYIYNDNCIGFKSADEKTVGWFDEYGNKKEISSDYEIVDIINNKIVLLKYTDFNTKYYIINENGTILKETDFLYILDNGYFLIQTENNKFTLYDSNMTQIANEYDYIDIL